MMWWVIYPLTSCFWKITELITCKKYHNGWGPLNLENELHVQKVQFEKRNKQTNIHCTFHPLNKLQKKINLYQYWLWHKIDCKSSFYWLKVNRNQRMEGRSEQRSEKQCPTYMYTQKMTFSALMNDNRVIGNIVLSQNLHHSTHY